jgi:hypothetical protein
MTELLDEKEFYEFEQTVKLLVEFSDGKKRTFVADSYDVNAVTIMLYLKWQKGKRLVTMIPYMMVRSITVETPEILGLLEEKNAISD